MTQFFRSAWSWLVVLFAVLLVVQFFLAGIGAYQVPKGSYDTQWGAHRAFGDLLLVLGLILLVVALAARLPTRLAGYTAALFVLLVIQFLLGKLGGTSASGLGALHAVNALIIVSLAAVLGHAARAYLPMERSRPAT